MTEAEKLKHCAGCRDDFYNGNNPLGVQRCWGLKSAKLITRFRIGTWTQPDAPRAFTQCKTLSCWHANGQHFYERLPSFVKPEDVVR